MPSNHSVSARLCAIDGAPHHGQHAVADETLRDARGRPDAQGSRHISIDLDVYVERGNEAYDTSALPSPLTQEMLDGGLEIAVGPAPLPVIPVPRGDGKYPAKEQQEEEGNDVEAAVPSWDDDLF